MLPPHHFSFTNLINTHFNNIQSSEFQVSKMPSSKTLIPKIGLFATFVSTIFGTFIGSPNRSLMARAAPFLTEIIATPSIFSEQVDGVWQLVNFDLDQTVDLAVIQPIGTPSGRVEVYSASGSSHFQTIIIELVSAFSVENDGTWALAPLTIKPDLYLIKTNNTPSGQVEVHMATAESSYQFIAFQTPSVFGAETDGTWSMFDFDHDGRPDLVFIKTRNAATGTVEVHVASASSNFQTIIYQSGSAFRQETDGFWSLTGTDGDLTFIKDAGTETGTTEVHVATRSSNYATLSTQSGSLFGQETDGIWQLIDFDHNGSLDLTFIKTSKTASGKIEVFAASG